MAKDKISFDISMPGSKATASVHRSKSKKKEAFSGEIPSAYKEVYGQYKKKLLTLVSGFLEQEFGVIIEWIKDMLNMRKKIRGFALYFTLIFAGIVLIFFGIARYLECLCITLPCGVSYVLVGVAVLVISMIYKRFI